MKKVMIALATTGLVLLTACSVSLDPASVVPAPAQKVDRADLDRMVAPWVQLGAAKQKELCGYIRTSPEAAWEVWQKSASTRAINRATYDTFFGAVC